MCPTRCLRPSEALILKVFFYEVEHHIEQMQSGVPSVNTMIFVRVDEQIELFIGLHQGVNHLHAVLIVYIIVGTAMHQQVFAS